MLNKKTIMTLSRDAAKVILELTEWFAHEKMIDATNVYEAGDKEAYREMNRSYQKLYP